MPTTETFNVYVGFHQKLINHVLESPSKTVDHHHNPLIHTGTINWDDKDEVVTVEAVNPHVSVTAAQAQTASADDFDWSAPVSAVKEDKFELKWSDDEEEAPEVDVDDERALLGDEKDPHAVDPDDKPDPTPPPTDSPGSMDIMAQQLKFVACLKILMEELSTLATGYEVDGGELRYHLYLWLEREVEALRQLCSYSVGELEPTSQYHTTDNVQEPTVVGGPGGRERCATPTKWLTEKPTLHEILIAEKLDFEAKVARAANRKKWLKANETLLRTLLSYCSLHGASGGGLASVRMELVLLLQELQQEKTQQTLLSPLPFPTTLPLLSASVACNKTVVADPVRHLQCFAHDMLQTIVEMRAPPTITRVNLSELFVLRDLAVALSACIYQSLCDSDTAGVHKKVSDCCNTYQTIYTGGVDNLASFSNSHLIASNHRKRRYSIDEPVQVCTPPARWPGVTNLRALLAHEKDEDTPCLNILLCEVLVATYLPLLVYLVLSCVTNLRALLAREKDEDTPRLNILLCEVFVATYLSLLVYAYATCDCHILYRLAGQKFTEKSWAGLFGGGAKKLLKMATSSPSAAPQSNIGSLQREDSVSSDQGSPGMWNAMRSITNQRMRLNMKILGQFGSQPGTPQIKEDKPTYREQFLSPEMSMVSYFLNKPLLSEEAQDVDYDSAVDSGGSDISDNEDDDDIFDSDPSRKRPKKENTEHRNPNSYAWCIMRYVIIKLVQEHLQEFLNVAGIELTELPVSSPLIHGVIRVVGQWQEVLKEELEARGPVPVDYVPGCYVEQTSSGPALNKYKSLLEKGNTPFHPTMKQTAPARRLWSFLVRQESVQDVFIRCVFGKQRTGTIASALNNNPHQEEDRTLSDNSHAHSNLPEPVRIIHKEHDSISAFCLNQVNSGLLALATPREVQEMDISLLLELPSWLEDECEFDIINLTKEPDQLPASSFLVIQTALDRPVQTSPGTIMMPNNVHSAPSSTSPQPGLGGQSGRGATVIKGLNFPGCHDARFVQFVLDRSKHLLRPVLKHKVDNIRRISAHPLLPLYLTGSQDGSVQMWEWGHTAAVAVPRASGTFAKVTRVRFSEHGNKFGVTDGDGHLSLWQINLINTNTRPFFTYQCHNKITSDFVFLGSCSLVATAGHSSESKNVCLWDSLLPQKKALVQAFVCHDQGASSLVFAPQHQLLISAGKKGDICVIDLRQRVIRSRFNAHESPVKCLAIDPHEEFFVTGAGDGDIKVWSLSGNHLLYNFPGEHARSSFFKHIGQGVTQLHVDGGSRLFSCGADGSMKVRQLPDRDAVVHTLY
ncbi:hypothetical protein M8J76_002899 [Diaphorina citri]|nr:hypothetical protein M8J76_002899 [Diaphorina citri]